PCTRVRAGGALTASAAALALGALVAAALAFVFALAAALAFALVLAAALALVARDHVATLELGGRERILGGTGERRGGERHGEGGAERDCEGLGIGCLGHRISPLFVGVDWLAGTAVPLA